MGTTIVTIGRQFGSNGRMIGKLVAEKLNVAFYDKELLTKAAKNSGMCEALLQDLDEKPTKSFLYSVVMDPYAFAYSSNNQGFHMDLNQQAFQATYDTIKKIAEEESCVIVGRCSDYILRNHENLLNVFIYAPAEERVKTVMERFHLSENKARDQIVKEDKSRSSYYNYYTSKKWGRVDSYDLCINSSLMSPEDTADYIVELVKKMK